MRKLILLLLIVGCYLPELSYSQTTTNYIYSYDGSGNRILREKVIQFKNATLPADSLLGASSEAKKNETFDELFEDKKITIYPNPTIGLVTVEISLNEKDLARIAIYDIKGKLLLEYKNVSSITEIDLSNKPSGTYLLKIFIDNKPTTWKIIKQN